MCPAVDSNELEEHAHDSGGAAVSISREPSFDGPRDFMSSQEAVQSFVHGASALAGVTSAIASLSSSSGGCTGRAGPVALRASEYDVPYLSESD